jgi:hypothetical protein
MMKVMTNKIRAVLENCAVLNIEAEKEMFLHFQHIFQAGFVFRCQVGQSIEDLLFRQLALKKKFVEEKVSTVFLDGQCVDDIASATLKNDSVVALSSALPGLAGATLRRGGQYACLRNSITYHNENKHIETQEGAITVKLFNLLMVELGPVFLRKGIIMGRSAIVSFFHTQKENFWKEIKTVHFEGLPIAPNKLMEESTYDNYDCMAISINTKNVVQ